MLEIDYQPTDQLIQCSQKKVRQRKAKTFRLSGPIKDFVIFGRRRMGNKVKWKLVCRYHAMKVYTPKYSSWHHNNLHVISVRLRLRHESAIHMSAERV